MTERPETQFSKAPLILKYLTSCTIYLGNFGNAIVSGCIGPSLESFGYTYNVRKPAVSRALAISSITYIAGAIFAGIIFRRMNRQVGAIIFLTLEAIAVALLPNLPSLTWFAVAAGVCRFCAGIYIVAPIAWIFDFWRHESGPFIVAHYFFYAIGSLITPFLLEPFLEEDEAEHYLEWTSTTPDIIQPSASPNFFVPFAITGVIVLLAAVFQLVLYFIYRKRSLESLSETTSAEDNQEDESEKTEDKQEEETKMAEENPMSRKRTIILIILCSVFVAFYSTTEKITNSYFSEFAINSDVHLSEAKASRVLSSLKYTYAGGLAVGIFLITKLAPQYLLLGNFLLALLGNMILLVLGASNVTWMWVGIACLGLGFSTAVPALLAFSQKYLLIDDTVACFLTLSPGIMVVLYPGFIITNEYIVDSPGILIFCNFANIVVAIAIFGILFKITYFRGDGSN